MSPRRPGLPQGPGCVAAGGDSLRPELKPVVASADNGSVAAQVDFTTRRYLADLLPAAEDQEQAPEAETPVLADVLPVPFAGRGPDAWMLLGSVAVSVWMIVATEIVVLVH